MGSRWPTIMLVDVCMGYFVHVRDQETPWIQVSIDRNLRPAISPYAKIAQPRPTGTRQLKRKAVRLMKLLTISRGRSWHKRIERINQGI